MLELLDSTRFSTAQQRDCARAFLLVARGQARSRADIAKALQLRSTTTSHVVAELVDHRLVLETAGESSGRGRPASGLIFNARRVGASVIHVTSQSLTGVLIDLHGQPLLQHSIAVPRDADNARIGSTLMELATALLAGVPRGMTHAGTAISLSGLIDLPQKQWILTSRWPGMHSLDIQETLQNVAGPMDMCRNLDAELRARAAHDPQQYGQGSTLLLHWGWGIGMAYARDGQPFTSAGGSFGEIGHWRITALGDRPCSCGNTGCLETGAALWALLPLLHRHWPHLAEDETSLNEQLPECDLISLPEINLAAFTLARALGNACRTLFPTKVIVTGPFVANAALWARFDSLFRAEGMMKGLPMPQLINDRVSQKFEIHGAAAPLLSRSVESILRGESPSVRNP